jgi:hypothetical protein
VHELRGDSEKFYHDGHSNSDGLSIRYSSVRTSQRVAGKNFRPQLSDRLKD